mmetsp:Transcript_15896/g.19896  ORF Transcript_15896/g.19896 Transcript_15896/m.19896 type:complete len:278 (-) Transcript_15896:375-1208(-)
MQGRQLSFLNFLFLVFLFIFKSIIILDPSAAFVSPHNEVAFKGNIFRTNSKFGNNQNQGIKDRLKVKACMSISQDLFSSSSIMLANSFSDFAIFYSKQLETNAYLTDVCTSVGIYSISNVVGQVTSDKKVDGGLLSRFALVGFLDGSFGYWWFPTVEEFFPGTTLVTTVEKMVADTAIYGTSFTVWFLFLVTALEKGLFTAEGIAQGVKRVKQDFSSVLFGGQFFWIPANGINYGYVPVDYRVLGGCVALLIYTLGLSLWELNQRSNALPQENDSSS